MKADLVVRTLGGPLAAELLGVTEDELERSADALPERAVRRARALADVIEALEGSYNAAGIRRWFDRPRTQLDGQSPRRVLRAESDVRAADRVLALARTLTSSAGK